MKKHFLFALALATFAVTATAQGFRYYTPWNGNNSYLLNVGTDFNITPRDFGPKASGLTTTPGLAASFRYEGDQEISKSLSWGYQVELSYLAQGIKYNELLDNGHTKHMDYKWWDLSIDMRLSFSYWPVENIELQAAAGIFLMPFSGISGESYETIGDVEVPNTRTDGKGGVTFNMGSGVSTMIQAKYFVTDEFFVSLNIHDNISVDIFGKDFTSGKSISKGGQRGIVMLGVGYKFYR